MKAFMQMLKTTFGVVLFYVLLLVITTIIIGGAVYGVSAGINFSFGTPALDLIQCAFIGIIFFATLSLVSLLFKDKR